MMQCLLFPKCMHRHWTLRKEYLIDNSYSIFKYFVLEFLLRPTWSTSIPTRHFQAVHQVSGPVLVWPQLRRRHSCAGLHCGGQTRGPDQAPELDWSINPLQKHVLPHPLGPGASGAVPLPCQSLQLSRGQRTEPGVWLCQDGNDEWVMCWICVWYVGLECHFILVDLILWCLSWANFFPVSLEEKKEEPETYVTVTIDTKHKVKDHYNVHEQLGV